SLPRIFMWHTSRHAERARRAASHARWAAGGRTGGAGYAAVVYASAARFTASRSASIALSLAGPAGSRISQCSATASPTPRTVWTGSGSVEVDSAANRSWTSRSSIVGPAFDQESGRAAGRDLLYRAAPTTRRAQVGHTNAFADPPVIRPVPCP